jgi:hypothetical protein
MEHLDHGRIEADIKQGENIGLESLDLSKDRTIRNGAGTLAIEGGGSQANLSSVGSCDKSKFPELDCLEGNLNVGLIHRSGTVIKPSIYASPGILTPYRILLHIFGIIPLIRPSLQHTSCHHR